MRTKSALVEEFRTSEIQEAALRVISRRGLDGTSMQAVAKEAGIAKGTIYLYFKNRDDMVARTASWAVAQLMKGLEPILAETDRRPFALRLRSLVETKIRFFHERRQFFRLYLATCGADKTTRRQRNREQLEQYLTSLAALLRRAMARGEIRRADAPRLALFLAEGVHAVIIRRLSEAKSPSPSQEADWIVTLLLDGLAKKGGRR
jgi:AcrR family transcriptional regulator